MVQRRAARWTLGRFSPYDSISSMLGELGWGSLEDRRRDARLCLFYKIVHGLVAVPLPSYVVHSEVSTRHSKKVREKSRECHKHKPQPFPDPKRKRKLTNLNKHKPNKRTKITKISSLFPSEVIAILKGLKNTRTK